MGKRLLWVLHAIAKQQMGEPKKQRTKEPATNGKRLEQAKRRARVGCQGVAENEMPNGEASICCK